MDRGLHKRVRSGLGAQAYARLVTVVVQVVTVPLLIGAWGVELYGVAGFVDARAISDHPPGK